MIILLSETLEAVLYDVDDDSDDDEEVVCGVEGIEGEPFQIF